MMTGLGVVVVAAVAAAARGEFIEQIVQAVCEVLC